MRRLELQVGQVNALMAWLHGGGHLIVGVEQISDIAATPWLRSVLPCELNDFRALQGHPELQEWLRSANWPPGEAEPGFGLGGVSRAEQRRRRVPG